MINFDEYQYAAGYTAVYRDCCDSPTERKAYAILGLTSEVGEVAGKFSKQMRGDTFVDREAMKKELGDVLWFVAETASLFDLKLSEVAQANLDKLAARHQSGTLRGNGDDR